MSSGAPARAARPVTSQPFASFPHISLGLLAAVCFGDVLVRPLLLSRAPGNVGRTWGEPVDLSMFRCKFGMEGAALLSAPTPLVTEAPDVGVRRAFPVFVSACLASQPALSQKLRVPALACLLSHCDQALRLDCPREEHAPPSLSLSPYQRSPQSKQSASLRVRLCTALLGSQELLFLLTST